MKAKDLRERTPDDLRDLEKSLARDTFTHRFKNFTNRLDDTSLIGKTRRDLARVKTLLREQALTGAIKGAATAEAGEADKPAKPAKKAAAKPKAEAKAAAPKAAKPKKASKEKSE